MTVMELATDVAGSRTGARRRDGLKARAGPPAGGRRRRPGRLQGRLLHHEARRACARGDRTLTTAGVGYVQSRGVRGGVDRQPRRGRRGHRPGRRAGRERGRRQRPGRHRRHRRRPARQPPRRRPGLHRRPADHRQRPDPRHQPGAGPDQAAGPPRRSTSCRSPGRWTGRAGCAIPRAMFGRTLGLELLVVSITEAVFQTLGALRRARPPAVRGRGRRALRLGPGRAGGRRDGPGLPSASTWAAARPRWRCSPAARLVHVESRAGRRPARDPGHRPRPFHLHRRRRADQDPARLGHRLGQRGPRDDRGAAARRRSRRRPGDRAALAAEGHHRARASRRPWNCCASA